MEPSFRRLTKRQQADLRGYVATGTVVFRAAVFLAAVAVVGLILRGLYRLVTTPATSPLVYQAWWVVPTLGFAAWLYRLAGRWTGGRAFRQKVRADLRGGVAVGRRVTAVDAIEIEQQKDEGPTFFLRTDDGRTMFFAGQYLERYQRKGFPWKAFDIFEAPESGLLMDIDAADERLVPSTRRGPLSWEDTKSLGLLSKRYGVLDVDFESLRSMA